MKKIFVGFAAILMLSACSRSESTDAANVESDKAGAPTETAPSEGAQPSERPSAADGTVKIKAGNTDVVVDKDGNAVTTGGVKINKDGVTTGGVKVDKDGVTTGGVKVNKDGTTTTTVGGVKVGKDGKVTVPGGY